MKQIMYITDPKVLAIPIIECNDPLIDIKNSRKLQYGEPPECELTKECYTKLRKSVFERLCQAKTNLPKGLHFRLYEGFRSQQVQQMFFEQEFKQTVARYPNESYEKHFYETTPLISPVTNLDESPNIPAHNTGGAVDIELINENRRLVDMGMAIKDWCCVEPELCLTNCNLIDTEAKKNRRLLLEIMQANGFVNYPTE